MPNIDPARFVSLPQLVSRRAAAHGDRLALKFIADDGGVITWSYDELWRRSIDVARRLQATGVDVDPPVAAEESAADRCGPRALLLFPPGLDFIAALVGCQLAGFTPVPTCYPRPGRELPRLDSAAKDCQPAVLLTDTATAAGIAADKLDPGTASLIRVSIDAGPPAADTTGDWSALADAIDPHTIAFLQYTSGSTSEPRGVRVRHRNLMANLEAIRRGFAIRSVDGDAAGDVDQEIAASRGVFWLPFYHDMGLIGGILEPLYAGGLSILTSPRSFLQRPLRWLQLISDERAAISGAPNFAYQLANDRISPEQTDGLDLSCWKTAFCGAEPILPRTLSDFANRYSAYGFSESAYYPCYGLAEATLLVSGGDGPGTPTVITVDRASLGTGQVVIDPQGRGQGFTKLMGCGGPVMDTQIVIVDPQSLTALDERQIGEVWIRGRSVTDGYFGRDADNPPQFAATLADDRDAAAPYCRTGDLGFFHQGQLFLTGRLKDVVILRGRNHFPQDIETTVLDAVAATAGDGVVRAVAFATSAPRGEALAIIAEVPRHTPDTAHVAIVRAIRRSVIDVHEIDPRSIALVRPATVPVTSSGKVQRLRCRELWESGQLTTRYVYQRSSASEQTPLAIPPLPDHPTPLDHPYITQAIEGWMIQWLMTRAGVSPEEIELDKPFADYGLDSMTAVELSGEVADWSGIELTPIVAWNHPSVTRLSRFIADQLTDTSATEATTDDVSELIRSGGIDDAEMRRMIDDIQSLSDEEIDHALADKRPD